MTANRFRTVPSRLARSMANFVSENGRFRGCFQDNCPENSGRSLVCPVGDSILSSRRFQSTLLFLHND